MNLAETALLLSLAAAYDQRTIGDADVAAWHALLENTSSADAQTVVKTHYASKRERIMPADVIDGVRAIRRERIDRYEHTLRPPRDLPDAEYGAWLRAARTRLADGEVPAELPPGRPMPDGFRDTFRKPESEDGPDA